MANCKTEHSYDLQWYAVALFALPALMFLAALLVAGGLTAFAVIFTWVFNHTKGSLLLMMLLAASPNTGGFFVMLSFPSHYQTLVFNTSALNLILDLVPLVPALLLIALTRGNLGYHHYQQEAEPLDLPSAGHEQSAPRSTAG